jgi:hypothetical protein
MPAPANPQLSLKTPSKEFFEHLNWTEVYSYTYRYTEVQLMRMKSESRRKQNYRLKHDETPASLERGHLAGDAAQ